MAVYEKVRETGGEKDRAKDGLRLKVQLIYVDLLHKQCSARTNIILLLKT